MKKYYPLVVSCIVLAFMAITGFDCASSEMTSANVYRNQKDYDKALKFYQAEVKKNPKNEEAYFWMGTLDGEKQDYPAMLEAFNNANAVGDKFAKNIKDAKKKYWYDCFNKGYDYFKKATNAASKDTQAVMFEKSANSFRQAIVIEPDSVLAYKNLYLTLHNLGKDDEAIDILKKSLQKSNSVDDYAKLGEIYYNKGVESKSNFARTKDAADSVKAYANFDEAISVLEKARKAYPQDSDILQILSNSYVAANKLKVAKQTFKEIVDADPQNKLYRVNYGVILQGGAEYADAETQFKKALEIDHDFIAAQYSLAVTYIKWADQLQKKADQGNAEDPEIKNKFRLALQILEPYVEKQKEDGNAFQALGIVYSHLNMLNEATAAFNKARTLAK
jgi:tetratricopeptide (TPR) repeat protein